MNNLTHFLISLSALISMALLNGCASRGPASDSTSAEIRFLRLTAAAAANEAVIEDSQNAQVLQEVSDALNVFCGGSGGDADSLFLVALVKSLPERLKVSDRTKRRLGALALLVEEFGAEIKPADYVAWGSAGCAIRDGIRRGVAIGAITR